MKNNKLVVGVTGASGSMGSEGIKQTLSSGFSGVLRIFFTDRKENHSFANWLMKKYKNVEIFFGSITSFDDCKNFIEDMDLCIHTAAMIPPKSDHHQGLAKKVNFEGTKNLVDAIRNNKRINEIYFVSISTVAVYGNRNEKHMWARVGDPLLPSSYDYYALYKLFAERYLLDANLPHFTILRQTAILHKNMFKNNMKDGLMFHTAWNSPLEWVTDVDSGRLISHLIQKFLQKTLSPAFWNNIYNIGGLEGGRCTGYETLNAGFQIMGRSAKQFFKPNWNVARNFHGTWFSDSYELNNMLDFVREDNEIYWRRMAKKYWYYKLGVIIPPALLSKLVIQKLFQNTNSPFYWVKHDYKGRIDAFYGSKEEYEKIGTDWSTYSLLCENKSQNGPIDYQSLKDIHKVTMLDHGYDESKKLSALTYTDLQQAAKFRGGLLISEDYSQDPFQPLEWECSEHHRFFASPFTILRGGHWCIKCFEDETWKLDKLASKSTFFGQVWYDTHKKTELDRVYPYEIRELKELDED